MQINITISDFTDKEGNKQVGIKSEPSFAELAQMFKAGSEHTESEIAVMAYALEAMGAIERVTRQADEKDKAKPKKLKPLPRVGEPLR